MQTRDRSPTPATPPSPAPLPSLPTAFSRRAALFGAVTATGFLGAAGTAALGQGMGITPIPSTGPADARLAALADAYEDLDRQCDAHGETYRGRITKESEAVFDAITSQFGPVEDEIAETPADTMVGVLAKARMCQSRSMRDMCNPEGRALDRRRPREAARRGTPVMSRLVSRRGLVQAGAAVLGAVSLPTAASALASVLPTPADPDAALMALLVRHRTATAEWNELGRIADTLHFQCCREQPKMPRALIGRYDEALGVQPLRTGLPDGGMGWVFGRDQVEQLRAIEVPTKPKWIGTHEQWLANDKTGWGTEPCPRKIARRAEILAAYDAWKAECDAVADRTGSSAATAKADAACDVVEDIELEILEQKPSTLAGFVAKAQWVVAQHSTEDWAETIVLDLCAVGEIA